MPKNLEIKARVPSLIRAANVARSLKARYAGRLTQADTYFDVPRERLKLRRFATKKAQLIGYSRPEHSNERLSRFWIAECADPVRTERLLKDALGIRATVKKNRILYMVGSTRIHLDNVNRLGCFIEFEVPIRGSLRKARRTILGLESAFGISQADYVRCSYIDLLSRQKTPGRPKRPSSRKRASGR